MADTTQVPPTFDDIRAILRTVSEETAELARRQKETDRLLKKQAEDSERSLNKLKGVFTSQWGELVESLVQGDLVPLLPP